MCGLHCHQWTVKPTQGVLINGMRWGNNQNGSTNNNIKQYQQQSQKERGGGWWRDNIFIGTIYQPSKRPSKPPADLFSPPTSSPPTVWSSPQQTVPTLQTHRHHLFLSFLFQQLFLMWMIPLLWDISGQRDVIIYWWSANHAGWVGDWCENVLCCSTTLQNLYVFGESVLPQRYSHSLRCVCVLKWMCFCFVPGFHLWLPNTIETIFSSQPKVCVTCFCSWF